MITSCKNGFRPFRRNKAKQQQKENGQEEAAPTENMPSSSLEEMMKQLVEQHGMEACQTALQKCDTTTNGTKTLPAVEAAPAENDNNRSELNSDLLVDALLQASFDGIILVDGETGNIMRSNEAARHMFGHDSEAKDTMQGTPLASLIGGPHADRHDEYLSKAVSQETINVVLNRMRDVMGKRTDGTVFPVKIGIGMMKNDDNNNKRRIYAAYCHDLTINKSQLTKIRDNVALTEGILNASFDAAFVTNAEGIIQRVNDTALTMFGYEDKSLLLGQSIAMIIGGPAAARHKDYFATAGGVSQEQLNALMDRMRDVTGKRQDGTLFPLQVGLKNLYVGERCHYVAYCHDLREVKRQLKVAESLLEGSFNATFLTNHKGVIQKVNQTGLDMFGYEDKDSLVGHSIAKVIGGSYGKWHENMFESDDSAVGTLTEERLQKIMDHMRDVTGKREDGSEFPVQVGLKILELKHDQVGKEERMFVAYCHDLTHQKKQLKVAESLLEGSFNATFLTNHKGIIQKINQTGATMFGYEDKEDLVGHSIAKVIGGSYGKWHETMFEQADSAVGTLTEERLEKIMDHMRDVTGKREDGTEFPVMVGLKILEPDHVGGERMFVAYCHDLTDQKKQLKVAESLLEGSFNATFLTNHKGIIQKINQTGATMFGYEDKEDLVGHSIAKVIGGSYGKWHETMFEQADSAVGTLTEERLEKIMDHMRDVTGKREDGTEFPVMVGLKILEPDHAGGERMFVAYCHDLTDQKKQLKVAESLLEGSFNATFLTNAKGVIQKVNQTGVYMFGYEEKEELVGHSIAKVIGGAYGKWHESMFQAADSAVSSLTEERLEKIMDHMRDVTGKREDGSEFPVQVGLKLLESDQTGGERMFVAYCHDLTAHKNQLQALEEEKHASEVERKLNRAILDSAFDSIFLVEDDGTIIQVNAAAMKEFGFSQHELVGENIATLVGGGHAPHHGKYMKGFKDRSKTSRTLGTHNKVLAKRKDGTEFPCQVGLRLVSTAKKIDAAHAKFNPEESDWSDDNSESTSNTASTTRLLGNKMVGFVRNITAEQEALALALEKQAAEALLTNMLPKEIALRLKENPSHIADHYANATILFADIVGFTAMSNTLEPVKVVQFLNSLFSRFDDSLDKYNLNKIKTIGDCYMATSIPGCTDPVQSCTAVCHFALDMIEQLNTYNAENPDQPLNIRIGMNCGPVVAGVVGTKRFLYDIWGDAVNIASRMESTGVPGRVQVTGNIVETVTEGEFDFEKRGSVKVKGIGEMETFLLVGRHQERSTAHWQNVRARVLHGDFSGNNSLTDLIHLASMSKISLHEVDNEDGEEAGKTADAGNEAKDDGDEKEDETLIS